MSRKRAAALKGLARLEGGLSVDAVITDYMMPGMDGGALSRRIAQIDRACPSC